MSDKSSRGSDDQGGAAASFPVALEDQNLKQLVFRAASEPKFAEALFNDPEKVGREFNLTADQITGIKRLTDTSLRGLVTGETIGALRIAGATAVY